MIRLNVRNRDKEQEEDGNGDNGYTTVLTTEFMNVISCLNMKVF